MPEHDWNDLKYLLTLARHGTLKEAGRRVHANETTVARRIKRLENAFGCTLFTRNRQGRYTVTQDGARICEQAAEIESLNSIITETAARQADTVSGTVRISAVPLLINHILLPHLSAFVAAHPQITLELAAESQNVDLSAREANLALRFARPTRGGLNSKTKKLGTVAFSLFAPADAADAAALPFIGYDTAHADLPQSIWQRHLMGPQDQVAMRVSDAATALQAVAAGLGKAILPNIAGQDDPRLRALSHGDATLTREVWLLHPNDLVTRRATEAAKDWLSALPWR